MWTRVAIALYRRTPPRLRRALIRRAVPTYAVGALVVVTRPDGRVLLVRQSYRSDWFLPGGLLGRGETPAVAAARELFEETGLRAVAGDPVHAYVDPVIRTVTAFCTAEIGEDAAGSVRPASEEIVDVQWFEPDRLPPINEELERALRAVHLLGR